MAQKLTSELVLKLTEQVTGPAAAARKALKGVEQTLAEIGKQRAAQTAVADLGASYEKARAKVRALQNELIATEKPSASLKASYTAATAAVDSLAKRLAAQKSAVEAGARSLAALGVAANDLATAEARLKAEAAAAGAALAKEAEAAAKAARQRRSLTKEIVRSANEEAAASRSLAAAEKAANEQRANSAAEAAMRRRISLSREIVRSANEEARANRAAAGQARRAAEADRQQQQERRAARGRAIGRAGEMAAPFVLGGATRSVREGAQLEHESARARAAGITEAEIGENAVLAAELSRRYPTIGLTSGMHALRNFRSVVGSSEEATHIADPLFKMRYVVEAAHPGRIMEEDFDKLIKGLEIKGVTQNMDKFRDYIQGMTQALNTFGDTLKPSDYYDMFKYGRQSTQMLSRDYMLEVAPTLAQELGGQGAGNAHASFHAGFIAGRMKASAISQLEDLGLVGDESKIIRHPKNHRILGADAGFLKETELAARDPYKWVQEVLLPAVTAKVGDDPEKIQEVMSGLASNRVAGQFLAILATQQQRIEKDRHLVKGAPGLESYDVYQKDPLVAWKGMMTQFDNLLAVASNPAVSQAAGAMQSIAAGLSSLAAVAKDHPLLSTAAVGTAGAAGLVGTYKLLDGVLGGFGLKASAAALDGSALALTEAAVALGAKALTSGLPGTTPPLRPGTTPSVPSPPGSWPPKVVPPATVTAGWWGSRLAARYPLLARVGSAAKWLARIKSPQLLALLSAYDFRHEIAESGQDFAQSALGLDPTGKPRPIGDAWRRQYEKTHPAVDLDAARRATEARDELRRERMRGDAMSSPDRLTHAPTGQGAAWDGAAGAGAATGEAVGRGVADGLGRQSGLAQDAARQIMDAIRSELAQGVTVPVKLDASGVASSAAAVRAKADGQVDAMMRSIHADLDYG